VSAFLGSLHHLQEKVEYKELQSLDEDDSKSGIVNLITVDESTSADAYSLAFMQVKENVKLF
jgi:hypothetical protein